MLEQLSSLRNIENQLSLQQQLEALVLQNQIAFAGGMIGERVEGQSALNDAVDGVVTAVRVQEDKAILEIDSGQTLAVDRVTGIIETNTT